MDTRRLVVHGFTTVVFIPLFLFSSACQSNDAELEIRQDQVARRGSDVMPFNLDKTLHVFQETEDGGLQQVIVRDTSESEQIELVRMHVQEEAERFSQGDFSDPARIHGQDMPGLVEMAEGAERIDVQYSELPDGAQIRYQTTDSDLVEAIHRWFEAQRSDHGRHAVGH